VGYAAVSELRMPHDTVDGKLRTVDTALLISFFDGGAFGNKGHRYIRTDGKRGGFRVLSYAIQGGWSPSVHPGVPMTPAERAPLDALLSKLPASTGYWLNRNAMIVSWDDHGVWQTRYFDRKEMPPEVARLLEYLGVPLSSLTKP